MNEGSGVRDRLIVALDQPDLPRALAHVDRIGDSVLWYKVGLQLFAASGRDAVSALADRGKKIFLDLKLHDIPATVEKAVAALQGLPVSLLTIHAAGGPVMIAAASRAARALGGAPAGGPAAGSGASGPRVLAVTMLTSLDGSEIPALWNPATSLEEKVLGLARLAREAGADGVVASPQELSALRGALAPPFLIVTPGIRGPHDPAHDQKRTLSLPEAFARGADYVVVGRPILEATDPNAAVAAFEASVAAASSSERTRP
ncbi:MAG TPA: orotidine-5'-phosphate decarboxylase [Candidatus Eisenbacteria bacterium]|nr:orotidine-5'-phosphate decarboxylase [Candidatus Eisenbacteria bacterium]